MRIPNPVAYRCSHCGHPAVMVQFPTGLHPVHCGTYRATCAPAGTGLRNTRAAASVSPPPHGAATGAWARRPRPLVGRHTAARLWRWVRG
jgi:hypothetical protein